MTAADRSSEAGRAAPDASLHLVEYNGHWAKVFSAERALLGIALAVPAPQIEHIGSSAVPGMTGKPVIDIMLGVPMFPPLATLVEGLASLGYLALGQDGGPGRHYFRLRGHVDINLHVVRYGGAYWRANLALRRYLRCDASARARYAAIKIAAVAADSTSILNYTKAKRSALRVLLQEALSDGVHSAIAEDQGIDA